MQAGGRWPKRLLLAEPELKLYERSPAKVDPANVAFSTVTRTMKWLQRQLLTPRFTEKYNQ